MGWTSINPSYFDVHQGYQGFDPLPYKGHGSAILAGQIFGSKLSQKPKPPVRPSAEAPRGIAQGDAGAWEALGSQRGTGGKSKKPQKYHGKWWECLSKPFKDGEIDDVQIIPNFSLHGWDGKIQDCLKSWNGKSVGKQLSIGFAGEFTHQNVIFSWLLRYSSSPTKNVINWKNPPRMGVVTNGNW